MNAARFSGFGLGLTLLLPMGFQQSIAFGLLKLA
jgi:hypothetical protein